MASRGDYTAEAVQRERDAAYQSGLEDGRKDCGCRLAEQLTQDFHKMESSDVMGLVSAVAQGAVSLEDAKRYLAQQRTCEDCGDPTPYRRLRCPACRKLVCHWCRGHVHTARAAVLDGE